MDFQKFAIYMAIMLMMINTMFFFFSQMPINQAGTQFLDSALSTSGQNAVKNSIVILNADQNAALHSLDSNSGTELSLSEKNIFQIGADFIFGGIGAGVFLIKYLTTLVTGTGIWIDFFLPPTMWWSQALGWMIKIPIIFLQMAGMIFLVGYIFSLGTGNKL